MSTTKLNRPREIIEFCLAPLGLSEKNDAYRETFRRLEHVIKTFQLAAARDKQPVSVDFSHINTITIDERAHGDD
jgi:hypothetical protein